MRVVIKVGTSSLTYSNGCINIRSFEGLCKIISDIKNSGVEVILVSSGAIGMGVGKLHLPSRPSDIAGKQACAAVGQCELMYTYDKLFSDYNHTVAQILLTAPDLTNDERCGKFIDTTKRLLEMSVLPIINENDTVATEEIVFGDNDTLAAQVAVALSADLLVLLSDIDGLYDKDPHKYEDAHLINEVWTISKQVEALAGDAGSNLGTGGMQTKIKAAKIVTDRGCDMVIANSCEPECLYDIIEGKPHGTRFFANNKNVGGV